MHILHLKKVMKKGHWRSKATCVCDVLVMFFYGLYHNLWTLCATTQTIPHYDLCILLQSKIVLNVDTMRKKIITHGTNIHKGGKYSFTSVELIFISVRLISTHAFIKVWGQILFPILIINLVIRYIYISGCETQWLYSQVKYSWTWESTQAAGSHAVN